jgi:hypothetical protein
VFTKKCGSRFKKKSYSATITVIIIVIIITIIMNVFAKHFVIVCHHHLKLCFSEN